MIIDDTFDSFNSFLSWFWAGVKYMLHVTLPKLQFKPVHHSEKKEVRAYCHDIHTVSSTES